MLCILCNDQNVLPFDIFDLKNFCFTVYISQDFGTATFVGAIAVMLHANEQRQSYDLDFVVAEQITTDEFLDKGYKIDQQKEKKFTLRGYKIDVYHERDLNDIPLDYIIKTAAAIPVDKKKGTIVNVISLEGLIVAKFRARRDQDIEDLQRLAVRCGLKINWEEVRFLPSLIRKTLKYSRQSVFI